MARTRQQQQAARAAARQWRRAELRRLLDAWQRVLRYPQTHYETSDELEHRIYTRFQLLTKTQRAANATTAPRTAGDVAQTTQRLKRSFLFISAYNQTHCYRSSSTTTSPAAPHTSASPSETQSSTSSSTSRSTTTATTHRRSWFDLQPQERRDALQAAQRGRRTAPYIDMDRAMYGAMQRIMAHTFAQLEHRRRSRSPSSSNDISTDDQQEAPTEALTDNEMPVLLLHTAATAPWSPLEVRRLLHAWHETVADPHRARVHSDAYLTALYERFVDSCEGSTPRCSAAVRTKKTALMRFGALIRDLSARSLPQVDWVTLTPAQRTQLLNELGYVCESADALDPALFVLLKHNLALEDDAYAKTSSSIAAGPAKSTASASGESNRAAARPVRIALDQDESSTQHRQVSDTVESVVQDKGSSPGTSRASAKADANSVDKSLQSNPADHDSADKSSRCQCGKRSESSATSEPQTREQKPQQQRSRSKRPRVDADLFVVLDILEREATRLRGMLQDTADARSSEQIERERLRNEIERERDAHERASAAWQTERAALQDEIAQLRKLSRPGLMRRRETSTNISKGQ